MINKPRLGFVDRLTALPKPVKISLGPAGGVFNRFPVRAVERARFIAEKRLAGYTYREIADMTDEMEPPPKPTKKKREDQR